MILYPIRADIKLFLTNLINALQPFAQAHSVNLGFECEAEKLLLKHHPEQMSADLIQLICRIVTFTPQNHSVQLTANLVDKYPDYYLQLIIENTGVNLSPFREIVKNLKNKVTILTEKEECTQFEIRWSLEKMPIELLKKTPTDSPHPPKTVRNFYKRVQHQMGYHFSKKEDTLAIEDIKQPHEAIFLQKVQNIINARLCEASFDVQQLARHMAMSRMQLHRRLKKLVQQSPAQYIRNIRLQKAKAKIEQEGLSIGEICFQLGFQSQSHFTRIFIKKYGVRPTAFRRGR